MSRNNPIIEELKTLARLDWNAGQKAFFQKRADDAHPVKCERMCDVLHPRLIELINNVYHPVAKQCYMNASILVTLMNGPLSPISPKPVKYVEGLALAGGLVATEHAFVKIGDRYIDPTFECALGLDVRRECYVSLLELDAATMQKYERETGYYGELYRYQYIKNI